VLRERWPPWKAGLYGSEVASPRGCSFPDRWNLHMTTCSWSKLCWSDNTNEQLTEVLGQLANTLNSNQTPGPNTNSRGTKACIPDTFSSTEPDKLNNFLFQCCLYFCANLVQFNMDIAKINFTMTYLTGVAQDWFEVGLN